MNYQELLNWGVENLKDHEVGDAEIDAWYLLSYIYKMDRVAYLMDRYQEIPPKPDDRANQFRILIAKRAGGVPVQYLMGEAEFMGLSFKVSPAVLIPRQDTELLVETALDMIRHDREDKALQKASPYKILDMCTGSGCIGISLAALGDDVHADLADISGEALEIACENVTLQAPSGSVAVIHSDLFENIHDSYDMIVSNPPYIATEEIKGLMREVRDHEPILALDGSKDGLIFYRKIAQDAAAYLKENGWLLFEIGYDQGVTVPEILEAEGYREIRVLKDLSGNDRVVTAMRPT